MYYCIDAIKGLSERIPIYNLKEDIIFPFTLSAPVFFLASVAPGCTIKIFRGEGVVDGEGVAVKDA